MAKGSRLPCKEGVRVGVIPIACTFLSMGTGEPDTSKVVCPVRGGTGRKGSHDLARGLPYLLRRSRFRQQLRPGVIAPRKLGVSCSEGQCEGWGTAARMHRLQCTPVAVLYSRACSSLSTPTATLASGASLDQGGGLCIFNAVLKAPTKIVHTDIESNREATY